MYLLTEDAAIDCDHELGHVGLDASQHLVSIGGSPVLVGPDPVGRPISGCPNSIPVAGIVPCRTTLAVRTGYSGLLAIDGHAVCLDTVAGFTDGTPPGTVSYTVTRPGQTLVSEG